MTPLALLTTLTLALTASALPTIPSITDKRQTTCSPLGTTTTTVGGSAVTLTGPFKITVSGPSASSYVGNYARAGSPSPPLPFIIFGVKPTAAKRASDFYLDSNNHLVTIQNDALVTAYENSPGFNAGHVAVGTAKQAGSSPLLTCSVDSSTCALNCNVAGFTDSCLASPKFQPDWRLAGPPTARNKGCLPFTPVVVPS